MCLRLQTTSLFLHWFPACVAWTERWHPDVHVREYNKKSTEAMAEWHDASLLDLVVLPMIPYLVWALLYYVKVPPGPCLFVDKQCAASCAFKALSKCCPLGTTQQVAKQTPCLHKGCWSRLATL